MDFRGFWCILDLKFRWSFVILFYLCSLHQKTNGQSEEKSEAGDSDPFSSIFDDAILKLDIRFVERLKVRLMGMVVWMVGGDAILKTFAKIWRFSLVERLKVESWVD